VSSSPASESPAESRPDFNNIHVVLVQTSHPGNIGAAARALKNMGIRSLRLVDPRTPFPSDEANWRAASATDVLQRTQVFGSMEDAVADCGQSIKQKGHY